MTTSPVTARPKKIAAFFDLDKTIIATSSASAFSKPFYTGGLISARSALSTAYAHFVFMMGGANADQTDRMRDQLSKMIKGWPVEQVSSIVNETLHQYIDPFVYAEALELIQGHKDQGHDVVIVSASGTEVVYPIGDMLGVDHVIATRMEIVDGRYTGVIEFYSYAENKEQAVRELAEREGYDLARSFAYSDSVTDVPMLSSVGNAYVVNADKNLRKVATENGWYSLIFRKAVALKAAKDSRRKALTIAGGSVAVLALALTTRLILRKKTVHTLGK